MVRVELNKIIYDIGYQHGFYFARAAIGDSPIGRTIEELSEGLSSCTGIKKDDLVPYLKEMLSMQ